MPASTTGTRSFMVFCHEIGWDEFVIFHAGRQGADGSGHCAQSLRSYVYNTRIYAAALWRLRSHGGVSATGGNRQG